MKLYYRASTLALMLNASLGQSIVSNLAAQSDDMLQYLPKQCSNDNYLECRQLGVQKYNHCNPDNVACKCRNVEAILEVCSTNCESTYPSEIDSKIHREFAQICGRPVILHMADLKPYLEYLDASYSWEDDCDNGDDSDDGTGWMRREGLLPDIAPEYPVATTNQNCQPEDEGYPECTYLPHTTIDNEKPMTTQELYKLTFQDDQQADTNGYRESIRDRTPFWQKEPEGKEEEEEEEKRDKEQQQADDESTRDGSGELVADDNPGFKDGELTDPEKHHNHNKNENIVDDTHEYKDLEQEDTGSDDSENRDSFDAVPPTDTNIDQEANTPKEPIATAPVKESQGLNKGASKNMTLGKSKPTWFDNKNETEDHSPQYPKNMNQSLAIGIAALDPRNTSYQGKLSNDELTSDAYKNASGMAFSVSMFVTGLFLYNLIL